MASWLPWVNRRRARLREAPLSDAWRAVIDRHAPAWAGLSAAERAHLEGLVQLFVAEKTFEGCGGLEMTDTIRVTVAAHACLLLLGLEVELPYPGLDVIRVYPSTYRTPTTSYDGLVAVDSTSHRLGESSRHGYLVLSWDAVRRGATAPHDGHNVVLHEFAHQLDTADGVADGAPILPDRNLYGPWAQVLGQAFEELEQDVAAHRRNVLDSYGTTNPAEFFAVATETFFERPRALREQEPALYAIFVRYYRQDPAARAPLG